MKKILVTTDFSSNASAAVLFAIQLASQTDSKLTFFHSYEMMRPTQWNDAVFSSYENSEHTKVCETLKKFVTDLYNDLGIPPVELDCVAEKGVNSAQHIMDYAIENSFDYICVSRKGHGNSSTLFGSNVSKLITKSQIPVIVIPENYKTTEITSICYASDLLNIDQQLEKVTGFTALLNVKVELLHFRTPFDDLIAPQELARITDKLSTLDISTHVENLDHEHTLIQNIDQVLEQSKPSMMIMFTQQNRSLFERIFLSSISAEYSAVSKIPLLVFKKD